MKWIKFTKDMDSNMKKDKNLFQTIPPVPISNNSKQSVSKGFSKNISAMLKKSLGKKFVEWVTYPKPGNPDLPALSKVGRRKYELFCGGFLYYHDIKFKKYPTGAGYEYPKPEGPNKSPKWKKYPNKNFEHMIFFEWLPKGKGVRIYINETPPEFNSNPPKPPAPPPPES